MPLSENEILIISANIVLDWKIATFMIDSRVTSKNPFFSGAQNHVTPAYMEV